MSTNNRRPSKKSREQRNPKPAKARRRRPRPLSDSILVAIAKDRFKGLTSAAGAPTPIKRLASLYSRDPAVISRAITAAFSKKLVEVREIPQQEERHRNRDLEEKLLTRFEKLTSAIVIESLPGDEDEAADPLKDALLQKLGLAMARSMADGARLRNGDRIGVGSGRGVQLTIRSLEYCAPLRIRDITLMSLTGSVYSKPPKQTRDLFWDSDRHVLEFADFFISNKPDQYLICHPLAHELADLPKARRRTWLADPRAPRPTIALMGVGIVAKGSRFWVEKNAQDGEPFLKPIHHLLFQLKEECEHAIKTAGLSDRFPTYSPAAQTSNVFFFVPPPPGEKIPNQAAIANRIKDINAHLLNIQGDDLRKMQINLVTGHRTKVHAVKALLASDDFRVECVCVDRALATEILEGLA